MNEFVDDFFAPGSWAATAAFLRMAFFVGTTWLVLRLLSQKMPRSSRAKSALRSFVFFGLLGAVPFVCVLAYQATWQLLGLQRPKFVKFMQVYDRRDFNPARIAKRGRILDVDGRVLAISSDGPSGPVRHYPLGSAAAHVVGYSDNRFGMAGLEARWHGALFGGRLDGPEDWKRLGRQIVLAGVPEVKGEDVRSTLHAVLQKRAYELLAGRKGAVVMLDPRTGAVLVLCSSPAFNPASISSRTFAPDVDAPMLNRALHGTYPPGSTFKIVSAAVALKEGKMPVYDCPPEGFTTSSGLPPIRDHEFYDYQKDGRRWGGRRNVSLDEAFTRSSNVYFARLAVDLGWPAFLRTMEGLGMGRTGLILTGDGAGMTPANTPLPVPRSKDYYGLAQAGIGQGRVVVTPIFMAELVGAIANEGRAMKPRLLQAQPPEESGRVLSEAHARRLGRMMFEVVAAGTASSLRSLPMSSAGKTGTAQNAHGASHAWYVGFAPYESPRLAFAVIVEHGGYGSVSAVPIARSLLETAFTEGLFLR